MRHLLHLLECELRRLGKTPSVPLLWLAFPLALSLIEYGAFGQLGKSSTGLPKGTLLLVDRDRSTGSGALAAALQREPLSDFFEVVKADSLVLADRRLLDNEASAALVVPAGFQDSVLTGGSAELVFTPNPREIIRPQMVDASLRTFLEIGNRFLQQADAAILQIRGVGRNTEPTREQVMTIAGSFYDAGHRFEKLGRLRDLRLDVQRPDPKPGHPARSGNAINFFAYFLPGLLLFSVLMVAQGFERRYFQARALGLTRRVAASPVRPLTVLLAEAAGILLGVLASGALILLLGVLLFKIPLRQPLVIAVVLLGYALFTVGLMKVLYGRARSRRSAETVASVVVLMSTLIGGGFAPVEIYSDSVRPFAAATPVGCASKAMVDALVHGNGMAECSPYVFGIWTWAIGLCALGFALAWRSHARA